MPRYAIIMIILISCLVALGLGSVFWSVYLDNKALRADDKRTCEQMEEVYSYYAQRHCAKLGVELPLKE